MIEPSPGAGDPVAAVAAEQEPVAGGLAKHLPPKQVFRYLVVGAWNTVFGYSCFFLLNRWLSRVMPAYSYIAASLGANFFGITVSFLGYKWFVFKTKGNYVKEWLRSLVVYSGTIFVSAVALAPLVGLIRHTTHFQTQAPYIAQAFIAIFTVISSFFGHKHLSFREAKPPNPTRI